MRRLVKVCILFFIRLVVPWGRRSWRVYSVSVRGHALTPMNDRELFEFLLVGRRNDEEYEIRTVAVPPTRVCARCNRSFYKGTSFIHDGDNYCHNCIKVVDPDACLKKSC